MTAKAKPDLMRMANDLEIMSARIDAIVHEVEHLTQDLSELATKTANFAEVVRETLAGIHEARVRGLL